VSLETRLDDVVYKLGLACSKPQARQLVVHGHYMVNGKKVTIPSYALKQGDQVAVREKSRKLLPIQAGLDAVKRREIPQWLALDAENFTGTLKIIPKRDDITVPIQENLIVEFYSR